MQPTASNRHHLLQTHVKIVELTSILSPRCSPTDSSLRPTCAGCAASALAVAPQGRAGAVLSIGVVNDHGRLQGTRCHGCQRLGFDSLAKLNTSCLTIQWYLLNKMRLGDAVPRAPEVQMMQRAPAGLANAKARGAPSQIQTSLRV
jgi:hypothetical protein